jgi:hypothetical protein
MVANAFPMSRDAFWLGLSIAWLLIMIGVTLFVIFA